MEHYDVTGLTDEEIMGMCADHYVNVCDVVLSNWSILCRSVEVVE